MGSPKPVAQKHTFLDTELVAFEDERVLFGLGVFLALLFAGNGGDKVVVQGTFKIDASKSPKTMDIGRRNQVQPDVRIYFSRCRATTRKPRPEPRDPGSTERRRAARQSLPSSSQNPPRATRSELSFLAAF